MNGRLRILLLGLLIGAAAMWWWALPDQGIGLAGASGGQSHNPSELSVEAIDVEAEPNAEKTPARVVISNAGETIALRSGLVVDIEGRPIPGVQVEQRAEDAILKSFETDSEGVFRFAEASPSDRFHVVSDGYMTLKAGGIDDEVVKVIAATTRSVTGMVSTKDSGLPIEGAKVTLDSGTEWVRRLDSATDWSGFLRRETRSDELGRFEFADAPDMSGGSIEVEKTGFYFIPPTKVEAGSQHLQLTMTPSGEVQTIRGIVLDAGESPVEGARISLYKKREDDTSFITKNIVTSDANGEFEITEKSSHALLTVVAKGLGVHRSEVKDPSEYLVIRMLGDAVRMEGLVVDAQGQPVAGAFIDIEDRSVLGNEESKLKAAPMGFYHPIYVEDVLNGWEGHLRSDASGRFSFMSGGPESYVVRVIDKRTQTSTNGHVVAHRVNRFVLDSSDVVVTRGKIVDSEGVAVPGMHVAAALVDYPSHAEQTEEVITGPRGEFSFSLAPSTEPIVLLVYGEGFPPMRKRIDFGTQNAVVTVARPCSVRLHWGAIKEWTLVSAHLADGEAVQIIYLLENVSFGTPQIQVRGEVSAILNIPRNVAFWRLESSKEGKRDFKFMPAPIGTITDVRF